MLSCEFPGSSGRKPYFEYLCTFAFTCIAPTHNGAGSTIHHASNLVYGPSFVKQGKGATPSILYEISGTFWSWHGGCPPEDTPIVLHYLCRCQYCMISDSSCPYESNSATPHPIHGYLNICLGPCDLMPHFILIKQKKVSISALSNLSERDLIFKYIAWPVIVLDAIAL
jgi:hypothetical protein